MNSNALAKLYDRLSPRERLPLIVAASLRGDVAERERLAGSAPTETYRVPNYHGLADGLRMTLLLHVRQMLSLGVYFWRTSAALSEAKGDRGNEVRKRESRLNNTLRVFGYLIVVELDGWGLFCKGLQIDPNGLLRGLPEWDHLTEIEESARAVAFDAEEVAAWATAGGKEPGLLRTADSVAADFRQTLERLVSQWA